MSFSARSLYDQKGGRLYLTPSERTRFLESARSQLPEWRTFAIFLVLTGCRISEALGVHGEHFDFEENRVAVETLKQRKRGVWRRIPLPRSFLVDLKQVHQIGSRNAAGRAEGRIWPYGRTTGFEHIKEMFRVSEIAGAQACPKGLRHTFAVHALLSGVPVTVVQRWMGHSRLETTQIYLSVGGDEEYHLAASMWKSADGINNFE